MIETWSVPVTPITGEEPRRIYVYTPDRSAKDPSARFPVLYMFDGHNVFFDGDATYGKSWGMGGYLDSTGTELIVVAVDCDHRPPFARLSEYSPFSFSDSYFGSVIGKGGLFMDWLTGTLKPMIDARYPTLPGRDATWIAGSSMGGLMSLYAATAYNSVFSRAAALSSSTFFVEKQMIDLIRETDFIPGTVVYMDYGEREMGGRKAVLRSFLKTSEALMKKGVLVTSRLIPNGDHCEACWEEQIPFFMRVLFYNRK